MAWAVTAGESMTIGREPDAFERLFFAEYPRVRAIALRTGLTEAEADDVAQDTFVQFHRRHAADAPFAAAWLRRAALHVALNALRSNKRRLAREERDVAASAATDAAAAGSANPIVAVEREERRAAVRAAMSRLPRRYAAVLALRYSGSSYAEIAAAADLPLAHVGTTLRRAEIAFKKEFDHASLG